MGMRDERSVMGNGAGPAFSLEPRTPYQSPATRPSLLITHHPSRADRRWTPPPTTA
jgi:hypothetical protein